MRIWNYELYENNKIMNGMRIMKLWMIWEYQIMNDMRIYNYEWYENI